MKLPEVEMRIHIDYDSDDIELILRDEACCRIFCRVKTTKQVLVNILRGYADPSKVSAELNNLDIVGKKMENKKFEFKLPDGLKSYDADRKKIAYEEGCKVCPEGWVLDDHFSSQGSFFTKKDKPNESWARGTIRRWV